MRKTSVTFRGEEIRSVFLFLFPFIFVLTVAILVVMIPVMIVLHPFFEIFGRVGTVRREGESFSLILNRESFHKKGRT